MAGLCELSGWIWCEILSEAEKELFQRLDSTVWKRFVNVYPQLPLRNIFGYDELMKLEETTRAKEFLLKTAIDFVVCEPKNDEPILLIEFDGIGKGFSREGRYIQKNAVEDPYRSLKLDLKLKVSKLFSIPMVVISFEENELLQEAEELINVLDLFIGDAIEKRAMKENYNDYLQMISEAFEWGGQEAADAAMNEIDFIQEQHNPIHRKLHELRKLTRSGNQFHFTKPDADGYLTEVFHYGIDSWDESEVITKDSLAVKVRMRPIESLDNEDIFLFNLLGEYCLNVKLKRIWNL
ncbi:DUF2726 domain-containing protein [Chitinophaga sancti]|uniref:DUF2726 domain-containing protein n=1 Tax=Chitinophaga sancti TaxID=1004 RepID=UPI002A752CCD|nr:DUF2726 domain-containing protein [Chitinophaga sancti]WPQ61232.1 DUF2726 domain-containing protein [Chitinophaga sancti]